MTRPPKSWAKTAFLLSLALILLGGAEWKVDVLNFKRLWQRILEERSLEVIFRFGPNTLSEDITQGFIVSLFQLAAVAFSAGLATSL